MNELAVQAANGTNSATQCGYMNDEVTQLKSEINRIGSDTKFNGEAAFGTTKNLHVGADTSSAQISITTQTVSDAGVGVDAVDLASNESAKNSTV